MILMVIILGVFSWFIELMIVWRWPQGRRFFARHTLANLAFSMALSVVLCDLFVASGVIALTAGLVSTGLGWITYRLMAGIETLKAYCHRTPSKGE